MKVPRGSPQESSGETVASNTVQGSLLDFVRILPNVQHEDYKSAIVKASTEAGRGLLGAHSPSILHRYRLAQVISSSRLYEQGNMRSMGVSAIL